MRGKGYPTGSSLSKPQRISTVQEVTCVDSVIVLIKLYESACYWALCNFFPFYVALDKLGQHRIIVIGTAIALTSWKPGWTVHLCQSSRAMWYNFWAAHRPLEHSPTHQNPTCIQLLIKLSGWWIPDHVQTLSHCKLSTLELASQQHSLHTTGATTATQMVKGLTKI